MTIAVIYGGRSGEHEISLISAAAIARNIDPKNDVVLIGITKDGRWFLQSAHELERIKSDAASSLRIQESDDTAVTVTPGAGMYAFATKKQTLRVDVVFPALHGTYGEDGTIQGLLEMADIPYVGCGVMASAVTMDKEITKELWHNAGLPIVPYVCMKRTDLLDSRAYDKIVRTAIDTLGLPLFVKPCSAGSSDGASKAKTEKELSLALLDAFQWDDKVLIEKAINAREVECSVTGNAVTAPADSETETVTAYGPGEIVPTHTFYDYDAKYNDPDGAALKIPADLPADMLEKVRATAVAAYKTLNASGLSRVDFFIDRDTGALYLNEINTIPGFTQISMFPKLCEHDGLSFTALTTLLIDEAVARYKSRSALQTSR